MTARPHEERDLPFASYIALRGLGGDAPEATNVKGRKTKTAILEMAGWRILPIPQFHARAELWHDEKGNGNPAYIDFSHPREWLVIPPEAADERPQKFFGRRPAIQWAWKQAMVKKV